MIFCKKEQVTVQIQRLVGAKGERGEQGLQGPQGERGAAGIVISTVQPEDPEVGVWLDPEGTADFGTVASEETRGCVRIGRYLKMNGDVLTLDLELLREELGTALPDTPDTPDGEVSLTVDEQGNATLSGAVLTVAGDGSATISGASLTVDGSGNAMIA